MYGIRIITKNWLDTVLSIIGIKESIIIRVQFVIYSKAEVLRVWVLVSEREREVFRVVQSVQEGCVSLNI
jgi:hypothetical protein